jgi:ribosomal protein S18 acetylase RimI-like enzyme
LKETELPIQIESLSAANRALAELLLREYSIEFDPADFYSHLAAAEHELAVWMDKMYEEVMAGERYYWLAYDEGELIGFVTFRLQHGWLDGSKYGKLDEFYIVPLARKGGRGRELAGIAFAEMAQEGAHGVQLGVLLNNERGLAFWQSLGLKINHYELRMPLVVSTEGVAKL